LTKWRKQKDYSLKIKKAENKTYARNAPNAPLKTTLFFHFLPNRSLKISIFTKTAQFYKSRNLNSLKIR